MTHQLRYLLWRRCSLHLAIPMPRVAVHHWLLLEVEMSDCHPCSHQLDRHLSRIRLCFPSWCSRWFDFQSTSAIVLLLTVSVWLKSNRLLVFVRHCKTYEWCCFNRWQCFTREKKMSPFTSSPSIVALCRAKARRKSFLDSVTHTDTALERLTKPIIQRVRYNLSDCLNSSTDRRL